MPGKILLSAIVLLSGICCTTENDIPSSEQRIAFTAAIQTGSETSDTRTSMSGSTASFTTGDRIGVSETLSRRWNVPYTYNAVSWTTTAPMYWFDRSSMHTFYAYYPYQDASHGTTVAIPNLSSQTVSNTPDTACDMLIAGPKTQQQTTSAKVNLNFTHAFSLIQFNIRLGSHVNLYTLTNITLQGGNTAGGTNRYGMFNLTNNISSIGYDLTTGTVQATSNTSATYATTLSRNFSSFSLSTTDVPFYFLILPGTYANPAPAVRISVLLQAIGSTSAFMPLSQATFAPGTKYVYNVRIGALSRAPDIEIELVSEEPIGPSDLQIQSYSTI